MMKTYEEMPMQEMQSHLDSENRKAKGLPLLQLAEVEVKTIKLSQGKEALVDDLDFDWLNSYKWAASQRQDGRWYAHRYVSFVGGKYRRSYMHREILGVSDPRMQVDHKNNNGLDNQRNNIRKASPTQNGGNRLKSANCSSVYKGVVWRKATGKWRALIRVKGRKSQIELGSFRNEADAARAYNIAATQYFGKFALLNVLV